VNNVNIATRRSYHHGNLRAALIEATLRAIAEDGPDGFTLRDVARRAGVSAAAPYRHFRDKEELLAAVAGECAERIGETMDQAVAATPGNALDKFRATGIAYVQFVVAHPEHFRALNIPGMVARMPEEPRKAWDAWNTEQRQALALAQAAGVIAPMPLDDLCLAANALGFGTAWVTEWYAYSPAVRAALGLAANERIAGFVYIGTATEQQPDRDRPQLAKIVSRWNG